jgi:hypothetical protein
MKHTSMRQTILITLGLLLAPLASSHAGDTPQPPVKVTQQMLNAIHTQPKLIFNPFPAYFSAPRDDTARASCGNGAKANSYHYES